MESGPNLAIFNLRIMCGMKRVIVFALKDNYELLSYKTHGETVGRSRRESQKIIKY